MAQLTIEVLRPELVADAIAAMETQFRDGMGLLEKAVGNAGPEFREGVSEQPKGKPNALSDLFGGYS